MIKLNQFVGTLRSTIWEHDISALPWWQRWSLALVRTLYVVVKDITDRQITLQAMSLVFTTILSMVPLIAVSFSVLKAFGVHNQIEPLLLNLLAPMGAQGVEINNRVIGFVENIDAPVLGTLGLALLIYTAISLIQKVESAFNHAWHVEHSRSLARRFSSYLSVIMIGPVLVFTALNVIGLMMSASVVQAVLAVEPFGSLYHLLSKLAPYVLMISAFTFMYALIPNTRVSFKAALTGGVVAGLLWNVSGWAFASFVVNSTKYTAIYSSFAIVLIFMIWLYLSWSILLVGASIAFYQQHPEYLIAGRFPSALSNRMRERLSLMVLALVGRNFYRDEQPWTLEGITSVLNAPIQAVEKVIVALEVGHLLARNDDEPAAYLPARPFDTTSVKSVLDIVRSYSATPYATDLNNNTVPMVDSVLTACDDAVERALDGLTLRELALSETNADGSPVDADQLLPIELAKRRV